MFKSEELKEEMHKALEEIFKSQREAEELTSRLLDAEDLEEARQIYLIHQVCVDIHLT